MTSLCVFLPNWVGDVVMATPALRALREHLGPDARLVGVMRPYVADVLAGTGWLDEHVVYDPHSLDLRLGGWRLIRRLRKLRLDTAILMPNSLRTAWLAWAGGARERIGYVRGGRGPLLNRRLAPAKADGRFVPTSAVDYFLELVYAAGCPPASRRLELATSAADEQAARRLWAKFRFRPDRGVVLLNTGGAFGPAKLWPSGYFAALARRIAEELEHGVLVNCGPSEREAAREIVKGARHPRVQSLADERLSIGLSKACVRRGSLMVTTDSGPRHFAAAFDVPCVTLFGPTHVGWSENYHSRAVHLQLDLDCVPCQRRTCPLGHHRCMRDLSIDEVYRVVKAQLEPQTQGQAA